jgi:hypothetical protein
MATSEVRRHSSAVKYQLNIFSHVARNNDPEKDSERRCQPESRENMKGAGFWWGRCHHNSASQSQTLATGSALRSFYSGPQYHVSRYFT